MPGGPSHHEARVRREGLGRTDASSAGAVTRQDLRGHSDARQAAFSGWRSTLCR